MCRDNYAYIDSDIISREIYKKYDIYDLDIPSKFGVFTNYLGGGICSGLCYSEIRDNCVIFEDLEDEKDLKDLVSHKIDNDLILNDLRTLQDKLKKLFEDLYSEYEYSCSDEFFIDLLENNDYKFYDNGELY
jgi:hypothetical protein